MLGDESLLDDLRFRHRPEAIERDGYGRERPAGLSRILEPEHVSTLMLVLHAIGENGGRPVRITASGTVADDLPRVSLPVLGHLCVNGLLTNHRDDDGWQTGYGPRTRGIARRWHIKLPPER